MANKILILGESGSGKTCSLRNFDASEIAVVNPVSKPLPFRKKFACLNGKTDSFSIIEFVSRQVLDGKKIIVIDDFQYILAIPYMRRVKECGWDKWNDFSQNYMDILNMADVLPNDVNVYFLSHVETLDNGISTIKLLGKQLREKITVEGLFSIVLKTRVADGKYYFVTENSGSDTVKSPMGMFNSYAIENDLKFVDDCIRNYYLYEGAKTDSEIKQESEKVKAEIEKPAENGRVRRKRTATVETAPATAEVADPIADDDVPFYDSSVSEEPKVRERKRRGE